MYLRTLLPALAAISLLFALEPQKARVEAEYHQSYPLQPGSKLTVNNLNGSIQIAGWDQNTLDISATRYAERQQLLDQVKIEVSAAADGARIRTIAPTDSGSFGVKYIIKVPRRAELAEIRSTNGSIHVTDIEGGAELRTSNGSVHATKTRGKLDVATSNGVVHVQNIDGSADLHTSNGAIHGAGLRGPLAAITSNGAVHIDLEESRGAVSLTTSNGGVHLKLGVAPQADIQAATTNGSITVRIPASAGARVRAETTSHSRISSDFDIRKEGDNSPSRLEGVIGSGGPQLHLTTSQGSIRLLKL